MFACFRNLYRVDVAGKPAAFITARDAGAALSLYSQHSGHATGAGVAVQLSHGYPSDVLKFFKLY